MFVYNNFFKQTEWFICCSKCMNEIFLGSYTDDDLCSRKREILRKSLNKNTKISLLNGVLKCTICNEKETFFELKIAK